VPRSERQCSSQPRLLSNELFFHYGSGAQGKELSTTRLHQFPLRGVSAAGRKCIHRFFFWRSQWNPSEPTKLGETPAQFRKSNRASSNHRLSDLNEFVPHLLPITRGIYTSIYATVDESVTPSDVLEAFRNTMARNHSFGFSDYINPGDQERQLHKLHRHRTSASTRPTTTSSSFCPAIDNL